MIVDIHCHAGKGEILQAPWTTAAPVERYLERAQAAGIDRTVVFPIHCQDYDRANAELADIVSAHPGRLIGFARVHTERDRGRVEALVSKAVEQYGFRGLKIHGGEAMPTREACSVAQGLKLPVLVDVKGNAQLCPFWAESFPDVNFIVAHLANGWEGHVQMPYLLKKYANLYADTSSVDLFDHLVTAIEEAGAEKILFGSDGPLHHPGVELEKVRLLNLCEADAQKVLGGNARRLLGF